MKETVIQKYVTKLDGAVVKLLLLTALFCCISEPLSRNLVRIILVLALARLFLDSSILKRLAAYRHLLAAMAAFCIMLALSAIYGGNPEKIIENDGFRYNYYMLLTPIMILFMTTAKDLRLFLAFMVLSLLAVDLRILYLWSMGVPRPTSWIASSFMTTGMFYCLLLPITAMFTVKRDETDNVHRAAIAMLLVGFAALVCTGTRAALIVSAFFCPLFFVCAAHFAVSYGKNVRDGLQKTLFFVGISSFVLAAAVVALPQAHARLQTSFDMNYQSNSERLLVWHSATAMFAERPLLGTGYGNFKRVYEQGYKSPDSVEDLKHSHSNYLQFLTETGLVGLAVYMFMLGSILVWLWRRKTNIFCLAVFFSFMQLALFGATDYTYAGFSGMRIHWLLFGAAIAYARTVDNNNAFD